MLIELRFKEVRSDLISISKIINIFSNVRNESNQPHATGDPSGKTIVKLVAYDYFAK